ncbi:unnamed protein product [Echinostoma caproni]|uniref:Uncharacterized protein n=1 Tax=Echinostoma caproni TaxID=27848 RepID=A0A183A844_9TREM|nr:unnamed protein product [Echinostoma caproni]
MYPSKTVQRHPPWATDNGYETPRANQCSNDEGKPSMVVRPEKTSSVLTQNTAQPNGIRPNGVLEVARRVIAVYSPVAQPPVTRESTCAETQTDSIVVEKSTEQKCTRNNTGRMGFAVIPAISYAPRYDARFVSVRRKWSNDLTKATGIKTRPPFYPPGPTTTAAAWLTTPRRARKKSKKNEQSPTTSPNQTTAAGDSSPANGHEQNGRARSRSRGRKILDAAVARISFGRARSKSVSKANLRDIEISGPICGTRITSQVFGTSTFLNSYPESGMGGANSGATDQQANEQSRLPSGSVPLGPEERAHLLSTPQSWEDMSVSVVLYYYYY